MLSVLDMQIISLSGKKRKISQLQLFTQQVNVNCICIIYKLYKTSYLKEKHNKNKEFRRSIFILNHDPVTIFSKLKTNKIQ